jgi:hypothetical protein
MAMSDPSKNLQPLLVIAELGFDIDGSPRFSDSV